MKEHIVISLLKIIAWIATASRMVCNRIVRNARDFQATITTPPEKNVCATVSIFSEVTTEMHFLKARDTCLVGMHELIYITHISRKASTFSLCYDFSSHYLERLGC